MRMQHAIEEYERKGIVAHNFLVLNEKRRDWRSFKAGLMYQRKHRRDHLHSTSIGN